MSEIQALKKLRKLTICDKGEKYTVYLDAGDIADEIEREIAERYMKLPVDADGVPIHLGDMLDNINKSERYKVTSIGDNGYIRIYSDTGWIHSSQCRHVKPDPVKELLRQYRNELEELIQGGFGNVDSLTDDFAARIREAVEK